LKTLFPVTDPRKGKKKKKRRERRKKGGAERKGGPASSTRSIPVMFSYCVEYRKAVRGKKRKGGGKGRKKGKIKVRDKGNSKATLNNPTISFTSRMSRVLD